MEKATFANQSANLFWSRGTHWKRTYLPQPFISSRASLTITTSSFFPGRAYLVMKAMIRLESPRTSKVPRCSTQFPARTI